MLDPSLVSIVFVDKRPLTAATCLVFGMTTIEFLASRQFFSICSLGVAFLALGMNMWDRFRSTSMSTLRDQLNTVQEQFNTASVQLKNEAVLRGKLEAQVQNLQLSFDDLETDYFRLEVDATKMARAFLEMRGIIAPDPNVELAQRYTGPAGRSPDLLIVEDNPTSRMALSRLLLTHGVTVAESESMASALSKIEGRPPGKQFDVILLDLMLPDGTGTDLLRIVRDKGVTSQVVLATGSDDKDLIDRAMAFQPITLLPKPHTLADLLAIIGVDRRARRKPRIALPPSVELGGPKV